MADYIALKSLEERLFQDVLYKEFLSQGLNPAQAMNEVERLINPGESDKVDLTPLFMSLATCFLAIASDFNKIFQLLHPVDGMLEGYSFSLNEEQNLSSGRLKNDIDDNLKAVKSIMATINKHLANPKEVHLNFEESNNVLKKHLGLWFIRRTM